MIEDYSLEQINSDIEEFKAMCHGIIASTDYDLITYCYSSDDLVCFISDKFYFQFNCFMNNQQKAAAKQVASEYVVED